jgi:hypothetical protein
MEYSGRDLSLSPINVRTLEERHETLLWKLEVHSRNGLHLNTVLAFL